MKLKSVRDLDVAGKTVLLRVDYNVPLKDGQVDDTLRIDESFETIRYLLEQECKIVLISHLGRPDGKVDKKLSLKPVADKASVLLGVHIRFVKDCVGPDVKTIVKSLKSRQIVLLENLRFHPEEEANDDKFAKQLAGYGEVYVDDAFACVHRAHASIVGVTKYLPSAAGFLVEREVQTIIAALENPQRPLLAVVGGAKIETKIDLLDALIKSADQLLIGGAMANTFLAAQGHEIGMSVSDMDELDVAKRIMITAQTQGKTLILPTDVVVTDNVSDEAKGRLVPVGAVKSTDMIADLGPQTVGAALAVVANGGTVIWNGPLGVTEFPEFAKASLQLAEGIIKSGITSIIGGGDTADFVDGADLHDRFTFVSTGGGASLELMAGKKLPGLVVLEQS
jgi:phosphoglycerate kinase